MTGTLTTLDDRTQEILEAIILNYINKLEPVGSRKIARSTRLNLSPATIRNIMADLEEGGFLTHPHTSAGRVPTDQAYRYFVQHLIQNSRQLSHSEQQQIKDQIKAGNLSDEDLIREIPRIINRISSYVGVSLSASAINLVVKQMNFILIGDRRILSVIIAESGAIYQKVLDVEEPIDQDELNKISNYVNETFQGFAICDIRDKITSLMDHERILYDMFIRRSLSFSRAVLESINDELDMNDIYLEGATTIFDLPELADVQKMKNIVEAFMEKKRLVMLLNEFMQDDGVNVCIGSESHVQNLMDLSFIISPYKRGAQTIGGLGVIGPKRMPYERMIALINYLSKVVSSLLTSREVVSLEQ